MRIATRHGELAVSRSGEGQPLLLLHGLPGSAASWAQVRDRLGPDTDVLTPDLLGFGASAKPLFLSSLHAVGQAEALLDVLDALALPSVTVVGHDFGGPVAVSLLALAPERVSGLGLLATNTFPDAPVPFPLSTVTWPLVGHLAARTLFSRPSLRLMLLAGVGSPRVRLDPHAALGDHAQVRCIRTVFAASLRRLEELYRPVQQALQSCDVEGFVLWGERDPFFSVQQGRRTADAFGARFTALEGAGHFLPDERPAEVAEAIRELRRRPPRRGPGQEPPAVQPSRPPRTVHARAVSRTAPSASAGRASRSASRSAALPSSSSEAT